MHIPISEAKGKLTELVRRAEAGEEIILTRHGHLAVRLAPVLAKEMSQDQRKRRRMLLQALHGSGKGDFGPDAARAADFLYDDFGVPA